MIKKTAESDPIAQQNADGCMKTFQLLLLAIICAIVFYFTFVRQHNLLYLQQNGVKVAAVGSKATSKKKRKNRTDYYLTVRYQDPVTQRFIEQELYVKETVCQNGPAELLVDPADPYNVVIATSIQDEINDSGSTIIVFYALMAFWCFLAGVLVRSRLKLKRMKNRQNSFKNA